MTAMSEGNGANAGLPEPSRQEYVARMNAELEVSLAELQRRTHAYESDRTAHLGVRADALFAAAQGYLDVLAAGTRPAQAEAEADGS